jgi:hypothetical protein
MELLVDHSDTGGDGVGRVVEKHVLPVDTEMAGAGRMRAAERFEQRALARAVFAEQRVHAAGADGKAHVLQRAHPGIRFGDAAEFQRRPAPGGDTLVQRRRC